MAGSFKTVSYMSPTVNAQVECFLYLAGRVRRTVHGALHTCMEVLVHVLTSFI